MLPPPKLPLFEIETMHRPGQREKHFERAYHRGFKQTDDHQAMQILSLGQLTRTEAAAAASVARRTTGARARRGCSPLVGGRSTGRSAFTGLTPTTSRRRPRIASSPATVPVLTTTAVSSVPVVLIVVATPSPSPTASSAAASVLRNFHAHPLRQNGFSVQFCAGVLCVSFIFKSYESKSCSCLKTGSRSGR